MLTGRISMKLKEDRGVAAVFVAISLFALLGAAVISVDSGSLWTTRRALITGTDAAALAAARYMNASSLAQCLDAVGNGSASAAGQEAEFVLKQNQPTATLVTFQVSGDCAARVGRVRVQASLEGEVFFARVFGFSDQEVTSASTAQFGAVLALGQLRPVALCRDFVAQLAAGGVGSKRRHRIHAATEQGECGSPNNWGWHWVDFDGRRSVNDYRDRLENGFDGVTWLDNPSTSENEAICEPAGGEPPCRPKPVAGPSLAPFGQTLDRLDCRSSSPWETCQVLWVGVFDRVPQASSSAEYRFVGFLGVVLRDYSKPGRKDDDDDDDDDVDDEDGRGPKTRSQWLSLEIVNAQGEGPIGLIGAGIPTVKGTQICGTEFGGKEDFKCDL